MFIPYARTYTYTHIGRVGSAYIKKFRTNTCLRYLAHTLLNMHQTCMFDAC